MTSERLQIWVCLLLYCWYYPIVRLQIWVCFDLCPFRPTQTWLCKIRVSLELAERGGFQKGGFVGCSPALKPEARAHSDVPRHQKQERGYIRRFPGTERLDKGAFAKTALLRKRPFVSSRPYLDCGNVQGTLIPYNLS